MKLNFEQLTSITSGAVRTWEDDRGFHVCRFTEKQTEAYACRRENMHRNTRSSSGIVLGFRTDSPSLSISVNVRSCSGRAYFSLDVLADRRYVGSLKNYTLPTPGANYHAMAAPLGVFSGMFPLGQGEKTVEIYLPWSVECIITALELADGASLLPVKRGKKLLAFGDSITQGYDALEPRNKYITRLADRLGMEEINKAVGGEVFWPELAAMRDDLQPDLITVAYGTNDWTNRTCEDLQKASRKFFENLRETYPDAPILALTPLWRKDHAQDRKSYKSFHHVEKLIRRAVEDLPGVTVIRGWELIPQQENLYGDHTVHPNDEGFQCCFENLLKTAEPMIYEGECNEAKL